MASTASAAGYNPMLDFGDQGSPSGIIQFASQLL